LHLDRIRYGRFSIDSRIFTGGKRLAEQRTFSADIWPAEQKPIFYKGKKAADEKRIESFMSLPRGNGRGNPTGSGSRRRDPGGSMCRYRLLYALRRLRQRNTGFY
jgi:hypothetical protein